MDNQKLLNGIAVVSASYMKRWLESGVYDKMFESNIGNKLTQLDDRVKYGIEFGLYALTAFVDQQLAEDTVLKKFIKEVEEDAGPEISKRLINHTRNRLTEKAKTSDQKEVLAVLLTLDDRALIDLLTWLISMEPAERSSIVDKLRSLTSEELVRLAGLSPEARVKLFEVFKRDEPPQRSSPTLSADLAQEIGKATSRLKDLEEKLDQKRKRKK
jgi:hypothetical protein